MKFKLRKPINPEFTATQQFLYNRGIAPEDMEHYLFTTDKDINDFILLGEETLKKAATALINTIAANQMALVIVD